MSNGSPKRSRRRLLVVLVVLAAGIGGGVWYLQGDSGTEGANQAGLPTNPDLEPLAFPDPDSFGFGGGPSEMCPEVNKIMSKRGYRRVSAKGDGTGVSCWFITTGLSLLADGSNNLNVDVTVWDEDAEGKYQRFLDEFTSRQKSPGLRLSKVEQFPVGDVGFISHQEYVNPGTERTDTTAVFRSGDHLMMIAMWGYLQHVSPTGEDLPNEPLTEEVTYREITDVMRSLSGAGTPGKPRITPPALKENLALAGLTAPELPEEGPVGEACAAFGDVAGKTGTRPDGAKVNNAGGAPTYTCTFEAPETPENRPDDYSERLVVIRFVTYKPEEAFRASERMGRELLALQNEAARDKTPPSPLYELPVGDVGYVLYRAPGYAEATAGYLVNGRTYVEIMIRGLTTVDGYSVPLPEDAILKDIAALLA